MKLPSMRLSALRGGLGPAGGIFVPALLVNESNPLAFQWTIWVERNLKFPIGLADNSGISAEKKVGDIMRYVSSLPPVISSRTSRELKAVTSVRAVRPVKARDEPLPGVDEYHHRQPRQETEKSLYKALAGHRQPSTGEDRRRYCRRTRHVPVLLDLRSGYDRRRKNQRVGDPIEHIDEEV